jgi:glucose/arabinose dehydrogenase
MAHVSPMLRIAALGGALVLTVPVVLAASVPAGKALFQQQCKLCHTAEPGDGGGAQGPSLQGVLGKRAGSDPTFSYSSALRGSGLNWDDQTFDRFLAAPTAVVPGTTMVLPVPNAEDRESLLAYLRTTRAAAASAQPAASPRQSDWRNDAPGRRHHLRVSDLPAPFATASARNPSRLVDRPAAAQLAVPAGFKVDVFATAVDEPRLMRAAPNGDIFVAETAAGRIKVLRPSSDGRSAQSVETFATGIRQPFGMAFYPAGSQPHWLYVAEVNRVLRYPYRAGDVKARAEPEVVIAELAATAGGHSTRDLAFSKDGRKLFVSVGSQSNVAESMARKSPEEIKAWEAAHGMGAAWDREANRAAVLEHDLAAAKTTLFATGIRNCVGLSVQPATGEVWCATNERDGLGDDLVPDYVTRVKRGAFYGWPWYYLGANEDPRLKGHRPDLRGKVTVPDVLLTAHTAALSVTFYTATAGSSLFPAEYRGDAFVTLHGSWNRSVRSGHKVVRVRMKDDVPTGEYEDFLTGFIVSDSNAWGRPVATVVAADGSLLLSDDGANVIYRISYGK